MTHSLPLHLHTILDTWDNLGFTCKSEAAEFILSNKDWDKLVEGAFKAEDIKAVNEWREAIWIKERNYAAAHKGI